MAHTIFTTHKVVQALDTIVSGSSPFVLGGQEDGIVKLYDLRVANRTT